MCPKMRPKAAKRMRQSPQTADFTKHTATFTMRNTPSSINIWEYVDM